MQRAALLVVLLSAAALAGCSSAPPPDAPIPSASATATATAAPAPRLPAVYHGTCEVSSGVSYGAAGTGGTAQPAYCPFRSALSGDLSNLSAALVEVVWLPSSPTVTGATALVQSDHCHASVGVDSGGVHDEQCNEGATQGSTGPLRIEVPRELLGEYGNDNMTVEAFAQGASTGQAFTIYVTLFEAAMPDGYTAVPA